MNKSTTSRFTWGLSLLLSFSILSACSAPLPTAEYEQSKPEGNITAPRLNRVLADTERVMQESAKAGDPEILKSRFAGLALQMRTAQQEIASGNKAPLEPIDLSTQLETSSQGRGWPRIFINVSESKDNTPPVVSVFRQESATENYHMTDWASLLPGSKWPSTARLEIGSQFLPDTATGFLKSPKEAVDAYVELINDPNSAQRSSFASDPFIEYLKKYMEEWNQKVKEIADTKLSAQSLATPISALDLGDNGALVVAGIGYKIESTVKLEGSSITLNGPTQVFLGDSRESTGRLVSNRVVSLIMVVPKAKSGEAIRVVGAKVVPISAQNQSWADLHPAPAQ